MDNIDFGAVYNDYKQATDRWVDAIRAEESLANSDHSMIAMEIWDDAGFKLHDAELTAKRPATSTRTLSAKRTTASRVMFASV